MNSSNTVGMLAWPEQLTVQHLKAPPPSLSRSGTTAKLADLLLLLTNVIDLQAFASFAFLMAPEQSCSHQHLLLFLQLVTSLVHLRDVTTAATAHHSAFLQQICPDASTTDVIGLVEVYFD